MLWLQRCLSVKLPCRLNAVKPLRKLNTVKLKHCECADALRSRMETALSRLVENPLDSITKHWNAFKETVNIAALNTFGKVKHKHQDWFDDSDNLYKIFFELRQPHIRHISDTQLNFQKTCFAECKINFAEAALNNERPVVGKQGQGVTSFCQP